MSSSSHASTPPPWLRQAVRGVLEQAPGYSELAPGERRDLAQAMVRVSSIAAALIAEEGAAREAIDRTRPRLAPLARAQEAPGFGASAERIAGITRNVLGAVSFPRFVTDLINGVFRAMLNSTSQQMQMYVQLLNSVSASAEGFERSQFSEGTARQWVADHFPDQIQYDVPEVEPGEQPDPEEVAAVRLRLRDGARMPGEEELRAVLGLGPEESLDASNPEQLVPLARRQIARQRQQMLATMVMLGMQRIVIDSGKINASMHFHIDTRSAAAEDRASQFGMQNRIRASGSYGVGPWGVSAEVENTISYVSTQRTQNTEEINTDLDLNSSVELNFRTDYLPLNQMAAQAQADRIRNASLNPAAATDTSSAERQARQAAQRAAEESRRGGMLTMPTMPSTTPPASQPPRTTTGGGTSRQTTTSTTTPASAARPTATTQPPATAAPPATTTPVSTTAPPASTQPSTPAPAPATAQPARTPPASSTGPTAPPASQAPASTNQPARTPPASSTAPASSTSQTPASAASPPAPSATTVGSTIGGAIGGAAAGAVGGAIGNAIAPGVGGVAGGAIGTAVGSAIGPTVGAAIGGAIGSAIGG